MTNWSVSTFKGKLKFFRFKIVKCKTQNFNRKFEIKPIPILHNISLNAILGDPGATSRDDAINILK